VWPYARARFAAERSRGITYGLPIGAFVFFAFVALWSDRAVRRAERGQSRRRVVSPVAVGRVLAALFFACIVGAELDEKVRTVQTKLWGAAPHGVPIVVLVLLVEAVLFAPLFWIVPAFVRAKMPASEARTRTIAIVGAGYLVLIFVAWIVYAAAHGV
jgi:MFS family permease